MNAIDKFMITYVVMAVVFILFFYFPKVVKVVKTLVKYTWKPAVLGLVAIIFLASGVMHFLIGFETTLKYVEQNYGMAAAKKLYGSSVIFSEVVALFASFQLFCILFPLENKNEEKGTKEQSTIEPPQTDHRKEKKIYLELEKVEEKEEI